MARPTKKPASAKAAKPAAARKAVTVRKAAPDAPKPPSARKTAPVKTAAPVKAAPAAAAVPKPAPSPPPKPAPSLPPKPAPTPKPAKVKQPSFSPKELQAIREELAAQRAMFERELEDLDAGSFNISQSELSGEVSFDEEYADAGTFTFERERDLSLSNNIRDLMEKVDLATRKLGDGTYGLCERCGRLIDKARLKALPYSVLCISCKQQEERLR